MGSPDENSDDQEADPLYQPLFFRSIKAQDTALLVQRYLLGAALSLDISKLLELDISQLLPVFEFESGPGLRR